MEWTVHLARKLAFADINIQAGFAGGERAGAFGTRRAIAHRLRGTRGTVVGPT